MNQTRTAREDPLTLIFIAHRKSFIATAARITGSHAHAEDIVHDAFVKLISTPLSSSVKSPTGYVTKMIRNLAIDHYRRKKKEVRLMASEEEGHSAVTPSVASPENISQDRQTLNAIDAALAELPPRTRYAFEMHRIHGFSQKDIATSLKVSPTLVNFMIRDALVHCRKAIDRDSDQ